MTTKTRSVSPADGRRKRPRTLIIADVVAAALLTLVSVIFMLFLIQQAHRFPGVFGPILIVLSVLSWFGGTSMFVLFFSRKRYGFYWTVIGIIAMFGFYYLIFFLAVKVYS